MTLSDISIRNPVFAWMLMAFLIVFGAFSCNRMGISQLPDVDFPVVEVEITLEGASPEVVETDVVDVVEDAVISVEGVREIHATARHGRASFNIEFDLDTNIDVAVQEVQTRIAQAQRHLPREIDPPTIRKSNSDDNTIMWISLAGQVPEQDLIQYGRYTLRDQIQTVPGVADIILSGQERNMRIWLRLEEMEARELTVDEVLTALRQQHAEIPAGRIESGTREMNVRSVGEAPSVTEFRKLVVAFRNSAPVTLEQIAVVEDGLSDRRRLSRALGVPSVGLGIKKQHGSNAVAVARGVRAKVAELQTKLPPGMTLDINSDRTVFVEESIHEIQFTLVLSVALTSIVCWLFLGSWTSTFNILLAIPTSIVGSFIIIYFLGFTLNTFTLLSLSLAVGIVVDDAIMVLENIVRHREKGAPRVQAASRGAREITLAAVAATLSIIAIFLPIAFIEGIIGKFLYQFGVTLSVAVALSLLEALTLTPMRCAQMLAVGTGSRRLDRAYAALASGYRRLLRGCLRFRWAVLLLSLAGFAASILIVGRLRQELVPSQDQSLVLMRLQTPVGSSIDYTDDLLRKCEAILEEQRLNGPVTRYFSIIGGFGGGDVDQAIIFMTLKPVRERPGRISQQQFARMITERFNAIPGFLRVIPSDLSQWGLTPTRGGSSFPIEFAVTGPDWDQLGALSEQFMEKMRESRLMVDVNSDYLVGMPEVKILPDRRRAADLGVSMLAIGDTLNALVGGVRAAKFQEGGHRFDVRVRLISDRRSRPEDLKRLSVRSRDGKLVRLSELVQVREEPTVQTITRRNRARSITLRARESPGASQKAAYDRVHEIAQELLPPEYKLQVTGSGRLFGETMWALLLALLLGALIAYMVLASQFNSFIQPFHVILAMPFSITGAFLAMWWADVSLNLYSGIGLVLLMGLVKKNSILLVEFTNRVRERGRPTREAILEACPVRLRPILMTSISTIVAAVPAAIALGPGAETRIPMAVVVIGGMIVSTLFTLFVVPCAYEILPGRVRQERAPEPEPEPLPEPLREDRSAVPGP